MQDENKYKNISFRHRNMPSWLRKPFVERYYADLKLGIDKLQGYPKLRKQFFQKMGYHLDLENPQSFNQKIVWKKLFDRNPLLTTTADKFAVRAYIEKLLGPKEAGKILIPLLLSTHHPQEISFSRLPRNFVVKPNHGCKMHLIVNGDKEQKMNMIKQCAVQWLNTRYGLYHYEWAYRNIKPRIIIEELLQTKHGGLPRDYKFYCFHGKCQLIRASANRFDDKEHSAYFDTAWNLLPAYNPGYHQHEQPFQQPSVLPEAIALAEKLSAAFDAVRVDLYIVDGELFFGEYTHYDASGLARFEPQEFDFSLGGYWKIMPGYWKKGFTKA